MTKIEHIKLMEVYFVLLDAMMKPSIKQTPLQTKLIRKQVEILEQMLFNDDMLQD